MAKQTSQEIAREYLATIVADETASPAARAAAAKSLLAGQSKYVPKSQLPPAAPPDTPPVIVGDSLPLSTEGRTITLSLDDLHGTVVLSPSGAKFIQRSTDAITLIRAGI